MCGIIGIFGYKDCQEQVATALPLLVARGQDGQGMLSVEQGVVGHRLHAIVGHVPQPLVGKGVLVANCEIYNWELLAKRYGLLATNDAAFLLQFLDTYGTKKLAELDGVYAFAYVRDGVVTLARDTLGVKPLWYSATADGFGFCSEKKILEQLGHIHIQELHPRHILLYENKAVVITKRPFFTLTQEVGTCADQLGATKTLLHRAIAKRIPNQKFGVLFSGGIDSTYIAWYLKQQGYDFTCYTAALEMSGVVAKDLLAASQVATRLGFTLKIKKLRLEDIPPYLTKIVPLIEDSNVVKVGVGLTFAAACQMAQEDGCKVIFSGLGSEEIFAGYQRHLVSLDINQECLAGLRQMYERDLYRDDVITMSYNLELRLPFLDHSLVQHALCLPSELKIADGITKKKLREIAVDEGIPKEFAFRPKVAAQYGSRIDYAIGKLAKKEKLTKSAYLRQFYPTHNVRLGVLCSSGKDSWYAAYIMAKQNYELACLITIQSANPDSYMFHTPAIELVAYQAQAAQLPLVLRQTAGNKEEELGDLHKALETAKLDHNIEGVVTGAVLSTYQRNRIEQVCDTLGLKVFSPLWHKSPKQEMEELLFHGFTFILTGVAADGFDQGWLGKTIDTQALKALLKIPGISVNGEGGEFESLVLDCPLFKQKIKIEQSHVVMDSSCCGRLIIDHVLLEDR